MRVVQQSRSLSRELVPADVSRCSSRDRRFTLCRVDSGSSPAGSRRKSGFMTVW
jgi:hypothetical protein